MRRTICAKNKCRRASEARNEECKPAIPDSTFVIPNSRKAHVLLLTAAFPGPSEPSRAVSVANAARLLARRFEVTVLTPGVYHADPRHEKLPHYEVVRFPYHTGGRILKNYARVPVLRLISYLYSGLVCALRIARTRRSNLIYANWVLPAGLIGAAASRILGIPLVVHAHGSDINVFARANPLFRMLAKSVLRHSRRVLAVGHDLLRTLQTEFGLPAWKGAYCPPIVDTSLFLPSPKAKARRELGLPLNTKLVLFVGDITGAKGAGLFFEAAAKLATQSLSARFVMLGDGPMRPRLLRESRAHSAISLPGAVPNRKVADYMRAADLLVLPSFTEGRPVSVLEAVHTGLPVLASKVGDLPEIITDGENGILVGPGDKRRLVAELRRLLFSPESLARLRNGMLKNRIDRPPVLPAVLESALAGPDYERYRRLARASHFSRRARERARAALSLLPRGAGTALDAGCGRGELLELLRACGFDAKGADISAAAVEEARRWNLQAEVLDLERKPVKGTYDAVFCLEVLEHLRDPAAVLEKLASAAPGGHLVVSLPNESNIYHRVKNLFAPNPAHLHRFSHRKAKKLFASAGLAVRGRVALPLLPSLPGLRLVRQALCRLWPNMFAISNVYLLGAAGRA